MVPPHGGSGRVRRDPLRLRLRGGRRPPATRNGLLGAAFDDTMAAGEAEADEFYADLRRAEASDDEAMVMRQAFAGMLWSKQYYPYDVGRWLDGDPGSRRRRRSG